LREVPKDVKIKNYKNFLGYQALNESLKWLRKTNSGMVKSPHMIMFNKTFETDNPQPSS
jgi:hypothetical protein